MSRLIFIYALCEPGTRTVRYIGKTVDLKGRLRQHICNAARVHTHLTCWLRSLLTRGEKPNVVTLCEVPESEGSAVEIKYIRIARESLGMNLVNSTDGGDGVTQTREVRAKISRALRGKMHSEEHRTRNRAGHIGIKYSKETRAKVSAALRGRPVSPETREKISSALRGEKNHQCGVPRPAELRKQIGDSLRAYHAQKRKLSQP